LFKKVLGISPQQYQARASSVGLQVKLAEHNKSSGRQLTALDTALAAASLRMRQPQLGMTPASYGKNGKRARALAYTIFNSTIGKVLIAENVTRRMQP